MRGRERALIRVNGSNHEQSAAPIPPTLAEREDSKDDLIAMLKPPDPKKDLSFLEAERNKCLVNGKSEMRAK